MRPGARVVLALAVGALAGYVNLALAFVIAIPISLWALQEEDQNG